MNEIETPTPELLDDIQELRNETRQLRSSQTQLLDFLAHSSDIITWYDVKLNPIFVNRPLDQKIKIPSAFFAAHFSSKVEPLPEFEQKNWSESLERVLSEKKEIAHFTEYASDHGLTVFTTRIIPELNRDGSLKGILTITRDISSLRRVELELEQRTRDLQNSSIKDLTTGLHNRKGFLKLSEQYSRLALRNSKEFFLIHTRLRNLKNINQNFNETSGDQALLKTAEVIKEVFRSSDIIARIGNDEFAIIASDSTFTNREVVLQRLNESIFKLNEEKALPFEIELHTNIIQFDPEDPTSIESMIYDSQANLHRA